MAPAILIIGATGNTGRSVASDLPTLLKQSPTLGNHKIIAQTRSKASATAQALSKIDGLEVLEKNWTSITASRLQRHQVERIFIASHNGPTHFAEESQLLTEALLAGVHYVVRISTTEPNVRPKFRAYHPRAHWAIETIALHTGVRSNALDESITELLLLDGVGTSG